MPGRFVWTLLAAALAGVAQAASIAWPGGGQPRWDLQLVSLAALAWLLAGQASAWRGWVLGQVFGTAWLCGTFWWLFISMHTYGGLAAPLAVIAVLGLTAFLALYYAAACAAFVRYAPQGRMARALLFASLWLLAELLRGHWFTGFPWGAGGYAHVDGVLSGLAPWIGVYGIGAVAALLAFLLAEAVRRRSQIWVQIGGVAVALVMIAFVPAPRGEDAGRLQVALLQGNIPQNEKFQPGSGVPMALEWYADALRWAPAPLVVAPETAIPLLPRALPAGYWPALADVFATGDRAALIGVPLGSRTEGYYNSVVGLAPGKPQYRYDKHHLVPFGEFVPPLFRWFTDLMEIPLGDFGRGASVQPGFEWRGQRLAPNICYEDLFGEEIGAYFLDAATAPTVLVNASNIGWFGDTVAIDQHLAISRMRALEFARPMLRATNTGATAIIDHRGTVTHLFPRHTRGVLVGEVEGRTGVTPYGWWVSRVGLVPLWALGLLPLLLAMAVRHRRRHVLP
ncbi:MAG: apolipoprotein N-acyltransferase [Burkholderiaceae bacterium]|nr:apolipoprotein N-acyltransferase [Burkholderiaceae bacterium]